MLIIKGIIIGIGKIIPGVSGSMLAISMGLYQKIIDSINNIIKKPKENIIFLLKIGIGIIISIIFFSNIVLNCLKNYYLITIFFFIGLIIGSINDIKLLVVKKNNLAIYLSFIIVLVLGLINVNNEVKINNNFLEFFFFIFVGFIDAITMVVPGISGTATLMMIGAYNIILETLSNLLDYTLIVSNIKIIIPFAIGLIIGVLITAKIINYLFKYHSNTTYSSIIGFSLSTIALMGYRCINTSYNFVSLIIGFIMLLVGIYISKKINHYITCD